MSILMNCVFCANAPNTFLIFTNQLLLLVFYRIQNSTALKYNTLTPWPFRKDFKQIQGFEHILNTSPPQKICFFLRITHIFEKVQFHLKPALCPAQNPVCKCEKAPLVSRALRDRRSHGTFVNCPSQVAPAEGALQGRAVRYPFGFSASSRSMTSVKRSTR